MNVDTAIANLGTDVKSFFSKLNSDIVKGKAIWIIISSSQTRSTLILIGKDVITAALDAYNAGKALGANVTLDTATVTAVETLIADAKSGEAIIVNDIKAIGVILNG
jgi:hypothetical protein